MKTYKVVYFDEKSHELLSVGIGRNKYGEFSLCNYSSQMQHIPYEEIVKQAKENIAEMVRYDTGEVPIEDIEIKFGYGGAYATVEKSIPFDGVELYNIAFDTSLHPDFNDPENDLYALAGSAGQYDPREDFYNLPRELLSLLEFWDEYHLKEITDEQWDYVNDLFDSLPEITPEYAWGRM